MTDPLKRFNPADLARKKAFYQDMVAQGFGGFSPALEYIQEIERLREVLVQVKSILWMAERYAEGGGSGGPEMRSYREVATLLEEEEL